MDGKNRQSGFNYFSVNSTTSYQLATNYFSPNLCLHVSNTYTNIYIYIHIYDSECVQVAEGEIAACPDTAVQGVHYVFQSNRFYAFASIAI